MAQHTMHSSDDVERPASGDLDTGSAIGGGSSQNADTTLPADADIDTDQAIADAEQSADQKPPLDVAAGTTGFLGAGSPSAGQQNVFDE